MEMCSFAAQNTSQWNSLSGVLLAPVANLEVSAIQSKFPAISSIEKLNNTFSLSLEPLCLTQQNVRKRRSFKIQKRRIAHSFPLTALK
jgi:hypothetical protein